MYPPQYPQQQPSLAEVVAKLDEVAVEVRELGRRPPTVRVSHPLIVTAAAWVVVVLFTLWVAMCAIAFVIGLSRSGAFQSAADRKAEQERWNEVRKTIGSK